MNIDPDIASMIAKFLAVNAGATLLLLVLAYVIGTLILEGLAALDRWFEVPKQKKPRLTSIK